MDLLLQINPKFGQGGRGSENPENFADVLYVWTLLTGITVAKVLDRESAVVVGETRPSVLGYFVGHFPCVEIAFQSRVIGFLDKHQLTINCQSWEWNSEHMI